jgi:2-amino-4-hydroxy-6-hydroxymethyldihydropteridine diphosphokinase
MDSPVRVAISLGSNLGDRKAHLEYAVDALALDLSGIKASAIVETAPQDVGDEHGPFLNACIVGTTQLTARDLLNRLFEIEDDRGRQRPYPLAPRTLDLDLILYGDAVISEDGLVVPHPHFRVRSFVLNPLNEIAPDMRDPVTGRTIQELRTALIIESLR